eukprot:1522400-Rhodomonas_salina.2
MLGCSEVWCLRVQGNTPRGSPAKKPYNLAAAAVMAPGEERTPEKPNKVAKAAADGFVELWKHLAPARAVSNRPTVSESVLWFAGEHSCSFSWSWSTRSSCEMTQQPPLLPHFASFCYA